MKKFEYKKFALTLDELFLNMIGADGWELVYIEPCYIKSHVRTGIFKREIE